MSLKLLKESNDKHKGVFYYINRKRKMGKQSSHIMTEKEYAKFQKLLRRAHAIAAARSKNKK